MVRKAGFYERYVKRLLDILISGLTLLILSPLMIVLTIAGAIVMKGNPFFAQPRPGKNEKIFKLIKFRTMTDSRDGSGNLLPDGQRLNGYGKFLRSTSLDELPELINILVGQMSVVGPRPLLVEYIPYYTEEERHRHDVLPGLTGLAQANGRNCISWEQKFAYDLEYVSKISFGMDVSIVARTFKKVITHDGVVADTDMAEGNLAKIRSLEENAGDN